MGIWMRLGIVISTNEPEAVWNAFRFGVVSLKAGHEVKVFLMNRGVEIEDIQSDRYDVKEQINRFIENKGQMMACGTCLKTRKKEGSSVCPVHTMNDLLELVEGSDKVLTFG